MILFADSVFGGLARKVFSTVDTMENVDFLLEGFNTFTRAAGMGEWQAEVVAGLGQTFLNGCVTVQDVAADDAEADEESIMCSSINMLNDVYQHLYNYHSYTGLIITGVGDMFSITSAMPEPPAIQQPVQPPVIQQPVQPPVIQQPVQPPVRTGMDIGVIGAPAAMQPQQLFALPDQMYWQPVPMYDRGSNVLLGGNGIVLDANGGMHQGGNVAGLDGDIVVLA
jgi:hypothetical protein